MDRQKRKIYQQQNKRKIHFLETFGRQSEEMVHKVKK